MTRKEKAFIQEKAARFEMWAKQEEDEARLSSDREERDEHYYQAALNRTSADTLMNLLADLEG